MVPSPRKRASRTSFNQTWDGTDAAFLDPASLPIGRIPRGWERKQEIKKTEEGRDKKIWRRFNLRSRAPDMKEVVDEEEHDAQSRAVKKQQHMSPKAMEKSTAKANGKKRTFKATRWDRRKSLLPRKKSSRTEEPEVEGLEPADESDDSDVAQVTKGGDLEQGNVFMAVPDVEDIVEEARETSPDSVSRRGTFIFTLQEEEEAVVALSNDSVAELERTTDSEPMPTAEDTTTVLSTSSPSEDLPTPPREPIEAVEYPELPNDGREDTSSLTTVDIQQESEVVSTHNLDDDTSEEADLATQETTMVHDAPPRDASLEEMESEQDAELSIPGSPQSEESDVAHVETVDNVAYPTLPMVTVDLEAEESTPSPHQYTHTEHMQVVNESAEVTEDIIEGSDDQASTEEDARLLDVAYQSSDEEFTEASLQLDILRDYQDTLRGRQLVHTEDPEDEDVDSPTDSVVQVQPHQEREIEKALPVARHAEDITDGLTLSFKPQTSTPAGSALRKLQSPTLPMHPAADDATMTIAMDDDTALLKNFLSRAAASKAEKAAVMTHRRESLQNRRDSDVVRHALASPRKVLEEKDPNSPSKQDNDLTLDLSGNLVLSMGTDSLANDEADQDETMDEKSLRGSRRSSRAKKSRLPALASTTPTSSQTSKISIRRPDGTDHVVLKKSDAQELALLTKANTRKNKQGAFGVTVRLLKLAVDAPSLPPLDDSTREVVMGKNIRWDEQLAYYQEHPDTVAEAESLNTPDELGMPDAASEPVKKAKVSKTSTPKLRRVRGLGTANGTPAKGLLAPASLLPDEVQEEREAAQASSQQLPKPKATKSKKMAVATSTAIPAPTLSDTKLPTLDIAPVGVTPSKERKSRLAAPKKVVLPQPAVATPAEGKENAQRTGIGGATPKKGIPAPKVNVPQAIGMESGLPRRRGRKL